MDDLGLLQAIYLYLGRLGLLIDFLVDLVLVESRLGSFSIQDNFDITWIFFLTSAIGIKPIIKYEGMDAITSFGLQVAHLTPAALKRLRQKQIKTPSQKLQ
jgi:hypothetical protein